MTLPTADMVILGVILLSAVIGLFRGLVKEVLSLAVWVCAIFAGTVFAGPLAEYLTVIDAGYPIRLAAAFGIIFFGVLIAGGLLRWSLSSLIESTGLGGTDRFLGFGFGALRGAIVVVGALIVMRPFAEPMDWWRESQLRPHFLAFEDEVLRLFHTVVSESMDARDELERTVDKI